MTTRTRSGMRHVLRTLVAIELRSPGAYNSRLVSSLPMEINLRGRALRARSVNSGTHNLEGSATSNEAMSSSPSSSSRFTDYSFGGRDLGRNSAEMQVPSGGFSEREREKDLEWSGTTKTKVYGDRRMAESAIDVLSVVEEDEPRTVGKGSRAHLRFSSPLIFPREQSSPTKRNRTIRYSSDASSVTGAALSLERGYALPTPHRKRHSSEMVRPSGLAYQRSFSHSAVSPSQLEKDERGPIEVDNDIARPESRTSDSSNSTSPSQKTLKPLSTVPFPSKSPDSFLSRQPPIGLGRPPSGPRQQHKRWNSELYIERPLGRSDSTAPRSRHESLVPPEAEEGRKLSRVARTKLVLREDGRPSLTYVRSTFFLALFEEGFSLTLFSLLQQLGESIGKGQFGIVYRALNLNSGRVVAGKSVSHFRG